MGQSINSNSCGCVERTVEATGETPRVISTSGRYRRDAGNVPGSGRKSVLTGGRTAVPAIIEADENENASAALPIKRAGGRRADAENEANRGIAADKLSAPNQASILGTRALADISNKPEITVPLGPLPSKGSEMHSEGTCKRCCFFPRGRCNNEYDCEFCHYEHEKRTHRKRKSKGNRALPEINVEVSEEATTGDKDSSFPVTPESDQERKMWAERLSPDRKSAPTLFYTVPVAAPQQMSAVPVFNVAPRGGEENKTRRAPVSAQQANENTARHQSNWAQHHHESRQDYQRLGPAQHSQWTSYGGNRTYAPGTAERFGSAANVEPPPGILHFWQDASDQQRWPQPSNARDPNWQPSGNTWSPAYSQWDAPQCSDQPVWECWMQADQYGPQAPQWNEFFPLDDAMPTSASWRGPPSEYSPVPAYMPAIQSLPRGASISDASESPQSNAQLALPQPALPPGVMMAVDYDPPPLSQSAYPSPH